MLGVSSFYRYLIFLCNKLVRERTYEIEETKKFLNLYK